MRLFDEAGTLSNDTVVYIPPKQVTETYRKHPITITFLPQSKQWQWRVDYTRTMPYSSTSDSLDAALKAAHKLIDELTDE